MPIYEYMCKECKEETEVIQGINDPSPACEKCGEDMERRISLSSFILKGGCWCKDGYTKKEIKKKE